jgi:hypothetical protein
MKKQSSFAFITGIAFLFIISCKDKKKEEPKEAKEKFFPAVGFILNQVNHIDTSLYSIIKVVYGESDSARNDTTHIRREDFAAAAQDFLTLPDLFRPEYAERYTESKGFDETIGRAWLLYTANNPEKEIIKDQKILIEPDPSGERPTSIIINTGISNKDSLVEKKLLWTVDKSFLVTTIRQLAGQPEVTTTYKVIWNEDDSELK